MFFSSYRRSRWRRTVRAIVTISAVLILIDFLGIIHAYNTFSNNLKLNTVKHVEDLPRAAQNQKIYICAQFWTSAEALYYYWGDAFVDLIKTLGPENVYVDILESGSLDNTADMLRVLDARLEALGVERTIILDPTSHQDLIESGPLDKHGNNKMGWILTGDSDPPGQKEIRRIPYLADIRNQALEPLIRMHRNQGKTFDKILYINDVVFDASDVLTLLATNDGSYSVACGIDFHYPPAIYDTFAARDTDGRGPVMAPFPYFRSARTRTALLAGMPAEMRSCWNGIVVVDAAPYYDTHHRTSGSTSKASTGLRFRGVADELAEQKLEASECCLIHADLIERGLAKQGIFMNPAVRVGYTQEAYRLTHFGPQRRFISLTQFARGLIANRVLRWRSDGVSTSAGQNMKDIYRKIAAWEKEGKELGQTRKEHGGYCTIHETQVLIWNGWKHVV